jgi:hypothetical protein
VIIRVVRQQFGSFRRCYEHGLQTNPALAGRVAVKFIIGANGDVTFAADGGSDLASSNVRDCVIARVRSLIFPKPEHGIVTVVYPVIFGKS